MTDDFIFNKNNLDYLKDLNIDQGGILKGSEGIPTPKSKKAIRVKHEEALTWLLKGISSSKMDSELKSILRMRMWGADPDRFCPLTCRQIAVRFGVKVAVVEDFEREAKERLEDYLKGKSLSDVIFTYNKDQLGGNVLTDKMGRPITG